MELIFALLLYGVFFALGFNLAGRYGSNKIVWGILAAIFPLSLLYFAFKGAPSK